MRRMGAVAALLALAAPAAAEPLTLDQVAALSAAGLGDEAIVAKVKGSGTRFDLSADQMIGLRKRGVSGAVIAAMLASGPAGGAASPESPDPAVQHPTGVYLLAGGRMVRMNATVSSQSKTGGIIGYALTGGLATASLKASIANETSRFQTAERPPVFFFFFDEANADGRVSPTWTSGDGGTIQSPGEFTLVRLVKKDGRREARVGSFNLGGAKSGVMDKDRIPFDYVAVRPGVYRVAADQPLPPGEYGFLFSLRAGNGASGAAGARIFDFTVT